MSTVLDTTRTQAFAEQALGIVNGGLLSLMLSVGHRTRLLDTLATLEPATSDRIAAAAGLNERYVREWLGAMVTGRIVQYDPATRTYWLPREHAASLTRAAGPDNLAELAQVVAVLGQVESAIVDVFRKGGGVDYPAFERFHALMAETSQTTLEATLLTSTLPLVPGLVDRLEAGIDVLDIGCGEGPSDQCALSGAGCGDLVGAHGVRFHHRVRRHSRSGRAATRPPRDSRGAAAGRRLSDGGYRGIEPP
jgi:hypothetical protein